jgi:hypothetical protein
MREVDQTRLRDFRFRLSSSFYALDFGEFYDEFAWPPVPAGTNLYIRLQAEGHL